MPRTPMHHWRIYQSIGAMGHIGQAKPPAPLGSVSAMVRQTVRVLIADDSAPVLLATSDLVGEYPDVEVVSLAMDVDEAVRFSAGRKPDLALVDAWLRGGGAELAARKIRSASPGTAVVALSSSKEPELSRKIEAAGGFGCYEKEKLSAVLPGILSTVRRLIESA